MKGLQKHRYQKLKFQAQAQRLAYKHYETVVTM
jgi:hypothetical protein